MHQPPYLKTGDSILIISTARKISMEELKPSIQLFESWGLNVELGKNLFCEDNQFAGSRAERIEGLQKALNDEKYKAVVCARGGYGTVQLIDSIDFSTFIKNPKWIVGYSDVTVLHNHINKNFGIETIHSCMPIDIFNHLNVEATANLQSALFGEELSFEFKLNGNSQIQGKEFSAPIVGGNLSILYSLTGTDSQVDTKGKFLFIEDLDEYLYHIDRMMMNLKRAGLFENCSGLLVGGMNDMNDNAIPFGKKAEEIICDNLKEKSFPIVFGIPAGHLQRNLPLIMNRKASLKIENGNGNLTFDGRA